MRQLGDKIEAKFLAEETGVPVAPWSGGPVADLEDGARHAEAIGYPMILKARSGGGGRGIRMVRSAERAGEAIERTQAEAERTFGDPVIFMERLVEGGRHIEVQVIADQHGNVWAPGVRDCSIQRRNQKLIEESGSPALTAEQDDELRESAIALVKAAGYRGAGTVEFLYQPEEKTVRLPGGEHPAAGRAPDHRGDHRAGPGEAADPAWPTASRLEGEPPPKFGHAIEARLNAEDADAGVRARAGQRRAAAPADRSRHPRGHRHRRRRRDPAAATTR